MSRVGAVRVTDPHQRPGTGVVPVTSDGGLPRVMAVRRGVSSNSGLILLGIGLALVTATITAASASPPDEPASPRVTQAVRDVAP